MGVRTPRIRAQRPLRETAVVLPPFRRLVESGDITTAIRLFAEKVSLVPQSIIAALAEATTVPIDAAQEATAIAEAAGCLSDLEAMTSDTQDVNRWTSISVPVLLMQGSDTWAPMPATMDALAGALRKATRVVWPGQSHFATHTAPKLFAETVRRFLRDRK